MAQIKVLFAVVVVPVTDGSRAHRFYTQLLGCTVHGDTVRLAELQLGNLVLYLREISPEHLADKTMPRPSIGIVVPNLEVAMKRLFDAGVELSTIEDLGAARVCFFEDPEGNTIHLIEDDK